MSSSSSPGQFRILYFSSVASYTKKPTEEFPAPLPIAQLFTFLEAKYPGINQRVLGSCTITINQEYVDAEEEQDLVNSGHEAQAKVIKEGDEVAIITPISSG